MKKFASTISQRLKAISPLVVLLLVAGITYIAAVNLDIYERFNEWTEPLETFEIDEIPIVVFALALTLATIALFKHRKVAQRTSELRAVNEKLGNSNDQLITEINERQRLEQVEDLYRQEMAVADRVAQIITSTLQVDQVYEKFALEVKKLVEFDRVNIKLVDLEANNYTLTYLYGPARPGHPVGTVEPLEGSQTLEVAVTHRTLVEDDITANPTFRTDHYFADVGLLSNITVPLIIGGHVIGAMNLRSRQRGAYGPRQQVILERLAGQIAPAIENARLHDERVRAEEQLAQAQKMESVGQLAGGIAHDFNNLLAVITGYTSMLLSEAPGSKNADKLREIAKAADRGTQLTSELLGFSRRQVIKPKVIDLSTAVMNSYGMLRRVIGAACRLPGAPPSGSQWQYFGF